MMSRAIRRRRTFIVTTLTEIDAFIDRLAVVPPHDRIRVVADFEDELDAAWNTRAEAFDPTVRKRQPLDSLSARLDDIAALICEMSNTEQRKAAPILGDESAAARTEALQALGVIGYADITQTAPAA